MLNKEYKIYELDKNALYLYIYIYIIGYLNHLKIKGDCSANVSVEEHEVQHYAIPASWVLTRFARFPVSISVYSFIFPSFSHTASLSPSLFALFAYCSSIKSTYFPRKEKCGMGIEMGHGMRVGEFLSTWGTHSSRHCWFHVFFFLFLFYSFFFSSPRSLFLSAIFLSLRFCHPV